MDKTLGQIAYKAACPNYDWARLPETNKAEWSALAAAVAAAVKEEDAKICDSCAVTAFEAQSKADDDLSNVMLRHHGVSAYNCAAAIRASIKEGQ